MDFDDRPPPLDGIFLLPADLAEGALDFVPRAAMFSLQFYMSFMIACYEFFPGVPFEPYEDPGA